MKSELDIVQNQDTKDYSSDELIQNTLQKELDEKGAVDGLKSIFENKDINTEKLLNICQENKKRIWEKLSSNLEQLHSKYTDNQETSKPNTLVDPRLIQLTKIHSIFINANDKNFIPSLIQDAVPTTLPPILRNRTIDEIAQDLLPNISKVIDEKEHSWKIVIDQKGRMYVVGKKIDNGSYKEILDLELLSSSESFKPVVYAQRNSKLPSEKWSDVSWEKCVNQELEYEWIITQELREKEVECIIKIWKVSVYTGTCKSPSDGFIMEKCTYTLRDFLRSKSIKDTQLTMRIALQLIRSYKQMHAVGYCHLDIKMDNILLKISPDNQTLRIRLCDFGSTKKIGTKISFCSSYPPPEMVDPPKIVDLPKESESTDIKSQSGTITTALDYWTIGDLLYCFMHGGRSLLSRCNLTAHDAQADKEQFELNLEKLKTATKELSQSKNQIDNDIAKLLSIDPKDRSSLDTVEQHFEEAIKELEKNTVE